MSQTVQPVSTWQYCEKKKSIKLKNYVLKVQFLNEIPAYHMENPNQMFKYALPDTKFKLVKQIWHKHQKKNQTQMAVAILRMHSSKG